MEGEVHAPPACEPSSEEGAEQRHQPEEERLLELHPPAEGEPRMAGGQGGGGEGCEDEVDPEGGEGETGAQLAPAPGPGLLPLALLASAAQHRQKFEREHRQDAGHDVEDEAARQSEEEDEGQR